MNLEKRIEWTGDLDMDDSGAHKMAAELEGKEVGGWIVGKYIGAGGTAFVCEATQGSQRQAIKIYDPGMVEKLGSKEVGGRIERQLGLKGKKHENLIEIYDGGYCKKTKHFYLVMEMIKAKCLGQIIEELPRERIEPLIGQVASAAVFLEEMNLVHRDIKPDNIAVTEDYGKAVLLDLGVIRPMGEGDFTDGTDTLPFLGTTRYSSPEYLMRREEDSIEGWRALTFYQLGAVLHDMVMRYPIFKSQSEAKARLLHAVEHDMPKIEAEDVSAEIIHLVKKCLLKDPILRVKYIQWEDFRFHKDKSNRLELAKSRIESRGQIAGSGSMQKAKSQDEERRKLEQALYDVSDFLEGEIRDISIKNDAFPPLTLKNVRAVESLSFRITICYERSEKHTLNERLTIIINGNILDVPTRMIELECAGGLCGDCTYSEPPAIMRDFFEGMFDKKVIRKKLNEILHLILDSAQAACERLGISDGAVDELESDMWIALKFNEKEESK